MKKLGTYAAAAGAVALTSAPALAQVVMPDTGADPDGIVQAALDEVTGYTGPAVLAGLALFAIALGVAWARGQMRKGKA